MKDVEKIVRQEGAIFGEYPDYEPGYYTFLADYLPYAGGDGMEHRNSTVMTSAATIATGRAESARHRRARVLSLLERRAHPAAVGLEPFDFDRANMSGELWLAEGFTQYYGPLVLERAGPRGPRVDDARRSTGLVETRDARARGGWCGRPRR